ncbi:MAG: DUF4136 domain-containing protein [Desulfobaccales bacterium]
MAARKAIQGLSLIFLGLFLSGCVTVPYQVQVSGYTQPGAAAVPQPPASFHVIDNREAKDPLMEQAIKTKIERLLGIQGYVLTTFDQADYYLVYSYGQGQGRPVTVPMPVYGPWQYGGPWRPYAFAPLPDYYYVPAMQTVYDRWLLVNVIAGASYRGTGEFQRLWQGQARSTGTSGDLRSTLNYLLVVLFQDFGKSTGPPRLVNIELDDFRAQELGY